MKKLVLIAVLVLFSQTLEASGNKLVGAWDTHTYVIEGESHSLDGIIIFTENYFAGTAYSSFSGGEMDDSNANAGTYTIDGNNVTFQQQVQIHIRPGDEKEPIFYGKDVPEEATFEVDGDNLTIYFPSGTKYMAKRLE